MTPILLEILAPPTIATSGSSGLVSTPPRTSTSRCISSPAADGSR